MMKIFLQGTYKKATDLDQFAKAFFATAKVDDYEERESSNYIDGYYFKGRQGETVYIVYIDDEFEDTSFVVSIEGGNDLEAIVNHSVRSSLIPAGFCFKRILNYGSMADQHLVDY
jgi:hypothetical protein